MHESKCQHIGKAPSLHLFHTTVEQSMLAVHGCSLVLRPLLLQPGLGTSLDVDETVAMPCHTVVEAGLNSKVKIGPRYESGENIQNDFVYILQHFHLGRTWVD